MTQTSSRFYDQFARFVNDAASVAQGVKREAETLFHSQAERFMNGMDIVRREDFDAVRDMVARAREENSRLEARIAELEVRLAATSGMPSTDPVASAKPAKPASRPRVRRTPDGGDTGGQPVES